MRRILILAYDGLEPKLINLFLCKNIMQTEHGETNINEYTISATPILWGSFLTGKNIEQCWISHHRALMYKYISRVSELLDNLPSPIPNLKRKLGRKTDITRNLLDKKTDEAWNINIRKYGPTIFDFANNPRSIAVPTYNRDNKYGNGRELLQRIFTNRMSEREFWDSIWGIYYQRKEALKDAIQKEHDLIMSHFQLADALGHRYFGDLQKMKKVYTELDALTMEVKDQWTDQVLIISDHGMKKLARFGDHSTVNYGFYSFSEELELEDNPHITDFYDLIKNSLKPQI